MCASSFTRLIVENISNAIFFCCCVCLLLILFFSFCTHKITHSCRCLIHIQIRLFRVCIGNCKCLWESVCHRFASMSCIFFSVFASSFFSPFVVFLTNFFLYIFHLPLSHRFIHIFFVCICCGFSCIFNTCYHSKRQFYSI